MAAATSQPVKPQGLGFRVWVGVWDLGGLLGQARAPGAPSIQAPYIWAALYLRIEGLGLRVLGLGILLGFYT